MKPRTFSIVNLVILFVGGVAFSLAFFFITQPAKDHAKKWIEHCETLARYLETEAWNLKHANPHTKQQLSFMLLSGYEWNDVRECGAEGAASLIKACPPTDYICESDAVYVTAAKVREP